MQVPSLNSRVKSHFHIELCMEMVSVQANSDPRIWRNWKCSLYSQCIFLKNSLLVGTLVRIPTYECIGVSNLVSLAVVNTVCYRQSWSVLATYRVQKTQLLQEFPLDPAGDQLRLSLAHLCQVWGWKKVLQSNYKPLEYGLKVKMLTQPWF